MNQFLRQHRKNLRSLRLFDAWLTLGSWIKIIDFAAAKLKLTGAEMSHVYGYPTPQADYAHELDRPEYAPQSPVSPLFSTDESLGSPEECDRIFFRRLAARFLAGRANSLEQERRVLTREEERGSSDREPLQLDWRRIPREW